MIKYKKYDDILQHLNDCEIHTDEQYHWWTGCIDGCYLADFINSDERTSLLTRLEEILTEK